MEKLGSEDASTESVDVYEIDLDEDGPLREEYLPKRRVSGGSSIHSVKSRDTPDSKNVDKSRDWEKRDSRTAAAEKVLPPPAKWSPEADEPIFREKGRASGKYLAVQPPLGFAVPSPPYQQGGQVSELAFCGHFRPYQSAFGSGFCLRACCPPDFAHVHPILICSSCQPVSLALTFPFT